jgi:anti-sigma factor RsiW
MACEKYTGWMMEAALGDFPRRHEAELLQHVRVCDACREAYNQAKTTADAVDRGVESLVAGEPSPQFQAHLYARIAQEPGPVRSSWADWIAVTRGSRWLLAVGASAVVLVSLLLFVLTRFPRQNNPVPNVALHPSTSPMPVVPQVTPQPNLAFPSELRRASRPRHPVLPRSPEPEVLVPAGQLEAVMQFADAIRVGRVDGNQLLAAQEELEKPLKIDDLTILPIQIQNLQDNGPLGADKNSGHT